MNILILFPIRREFSFSEYYEKKRKFITDNVEFFKILSFFFRFFFNKHRVDFGVSQWWKDLPWRRHSSKNFLKENSKTILGYKESLDENFLFKKLLQRAINFINRVKQVGIVPSSSIEKEIGRPTRSRLPFRFKTGLLKTETLKRKILFRKCEEIRFRASEGMRNGFHPSHYVPIRFIILKNPL
ncbi:hypothetical protein DLM75_07800 [Leptospira stimsonii]|uniref:Uncharacterized protein n=1 Tax=Leptospira stimsonii TaxID=2202203 RepID=A0A396ZCV4_9LEPT|nr:hypothetical protein DLM75_07800 [Leptospira stimsonii]